MIRCSMLDDIKECPFNQDTNYECAQCHKMEEMTWKVTSEGKHKLITNLKVFKGVTLCEDCYEEKIANG